MGGILIALFVWASLTGINEESSRYFIAPLVIALAGASIAVAAVSYFVDSEKLRAPLAFAAYLFLVAGISNLVLSTGVANSPFLAIWLIAILFVGAFGNTAFVGLFIVVNAYLVYLVTGGDYGKESLVNVILVAELPLIISYILWHESSKNQSKKDRAYFDLANQLNQVSNKSDVVIGAINDGVIAINNDSVIELINPAATRIVGWGHQDAIGLNYKSVLQLLGKDGHEVEKVNDPVFEVLSTNQSVRRTDLQLQTSSGKKLNAQIVVSPIGRMGSGAIIVFRDITKEQEEERAQAEFISTASHEMRTPVASIEGYLGLALNPATANIDEKARDFITKAHESAQHLGRLFQDLLDVTKADDGRLSNNPKVINVIEFMSMVIEGLKPKADAKQLRVFFKAETVQDNRMPEGGLRNLTPVYFVDLDSDHLREVLSNLVENAIKYTPKGQVVVDVQGDDTHVVISIADSGIGIPTEDIPHLFQKFYRVDNTDTREIGGTGLGLYLCRRLVETMGGRIWVESEYKKGSTFYVELPRISHEEANRLIEAAVAEPTQTSSDKAYMHPVSDEDSEEAAEIAERRKEALATPIVMKHTEPVGTAPAPAPVASEPQPAADPLMPTPDPEPASATVDPLVGTPPAQAEQASAPVGQPNHMVLPSNMQAVQSNIQYANPPATPTAPTPVPAPAPAQKPIPAPAPASIPATSPAQPATAPVQAAPIPVTSSSAAAVAPAPVQQTAPAPAPTAAPRAPAVHAPRTQPSARPATTPIAQQPTGASNEVPQA